MVSSSTVIYIGSSKSIGPLRDFGINYVKKKKCWPRRAIWFPSKIETMRLNFTLNMFFKIICRSTSIFLNEIFYLRFQIYKGRKILLSDMTFLWPWPQGEGRVKVRSLEYRNSLLIWFGNHLNKNIDASRSIRFSTRIPMATFNHGQLLNFK